MKDKYLLVILLILLVAGCKKDDSNPASSEFSNKLTLGIGADYSKFVITGETNTFVRVGGFVAIFWRLESQEDMKGSAVKMHIEKMSAGSYAFFKDFDFPNPQSYGHIMISNFNILDAGNYRVTGILVDSNVNVASKEFTVQ